MNLKSHIVMIAMAFSIAAPANAQSVISAGRAIQIEIRGVPQEEVARVNGLYTVSDSGLISMPFIGNVRAAGLSATALGASIAAAYRAAHIYNNPNVQVQADSLSTQQKLMVHIGGQVRRTGPVDFVPGLTIYQAIQSAGGPTEFGAMNRVELLREGRIRTLDLKQTQMKGFTLLKDDTITVPEKGPFGN
jgi:polysaccharide export outer membrane protein